MAAVQGRPRMDIVIVGHVDHGKSTVIGRLLADTGSLPDGKLEAIRAFCAANSRPFEYAFLLDALKDEQAQGITIDTARTFFKSGNRDYVIIDAPGHIEFLKNMVTGAARAEAAVLVIDAKEGIQENSKRHGYLLAMLGIRQIVVVVNKMDLVDYSRQAFEDIRDEYVAFLARIGATPRFFVPIAAFPGENMVKPSEKMPWYKGPDLLSAVDAFEKAPPKTGQPMRMPVQDVYKFTASGDDRRIVAGRVESGTLRVGDEVVFLPSGKKSKVRGIEGFNAPSRNEIHAGWSAGVTLETQVYLGRGELMAKVGEQLPEVSNRIRVNIFWMGKAALRMGRDYFLKLGSAKVPVRLHHINYLIDASESGRDHDPDRVERHDVADCILQLRKPIAFDLTSAIEATGRFVIVDQYEIAGGGIIREALAADDEKNADFGPSHQYLTQRNISFQKRTQLLGYSGAVAVFVGLNPAFREAVKILESRWLEKKIPAEPLGLVVSSEDGSTLQRSQQQSPELLHLLGMAAYHRADTGATVWLLLDELDKEDAQMLSDIINPIPILWVSDKPFEVSVSDERDKILVSSRTSSIELADKVDFSLAERIKPYPYDPLKPL
jgi:bifunctional enzyme CysN/CysC